VVILAIWTLRLAVVAAAFPVGQISAARGRIAMVVAGIVSLSVLSFTVSAAKRPRMPWSNRIYALKVPQELAGLAPLLLTESGTKPRFAMAHQPSDSREIDDAARLVALSGVPAYISCPKVLLTIGGTVGEDARRRLAVIDRLDHAPNLDALRTLMQQEGITAYVVSLASDAPFDPERLGAIGHQGEYAIYAAK
jgi:hypothetical protein